MSAMERLAERCLGDVNEQNYTPEEVAAKAVVIIEKGDIGWEVWHQLAGMVGCTSPDGSAELGQVAAYKTDRDAAVKGLVAARTALERGLTLSDRIAPGGPTVGEAIAHAKLDDWVLVPKHLSSSPGADAELSGEFHEVTAHGTVLFISWNNIKKIYHRAVSYVSGEARCRTCGAPGCEDHVRGRQFGG